MHFTSDTPTYFEWFALILQDAAKAKQLMIAIKARDRREGLMADPSLQISVENYERAQRLIHAAQGDPDQIQHVSYLAKLGKASLGPYPDRNEWLRLIHQDAAFAEDVCTAIRTKQALFGSRTPRAVIDSIEAYYAARAECEA
jgi:hypothetical protein